jgi:hypothetical protein
MPIRSDDIKLLQSAVMADTPEGGGAMTAVEVIDGQSNNVFPDVSSGDRAAGRFSTRKLFGVAHTDDTDTALGAHFAVLAPPADPLVSVALFETDAWADTRAQAQDKVERYLVKGPRLACRIMETHYTGARLLQLYQVSGSSFPAGGDAIALRNPNGTEQYVRVLKVTQSSGTFLSTEGGTVVSFQANVAVCELGQPLEFDVLGPPLARAVAEGSTYAIPYSTTIASGAEFHGVKALAAPAAMGERSVMLDGGIYLPIVPAATVEEPLIDIAPLVRRQSLSRTGIATLTLPVQAMALAPGVVLRLPTAAQPGTVAVSSGAISFTDDGGGNLMQGTLAVATVDYRARTVTFLPSAPPYASAAVTVAYLPATPAGAATHSDSLPITTANQGLAFTDAFEPPPAPGTFVVSYMAQGRWYDLVDNGNGRLAGAGLGQGSGNINYTSGSVAITLGAVPDVGSRLIYTWGDAAQAETVAVADRPTRLNAVFQLDGRIVDSTLGLAWTVNGAARTATCNAAGVITGSATGTCRGGLVTLAPDNIPDVGSLTATFDRVAAPQTAMTNNGGGSYTLTIAPVNPGSVIVTVPVVPEAAFDLPASLTLYDNGAGALIATIGTLNVGVGTVNYTTGAVTIGAGVQADVYERVVSSYFTATGATAYYESRVLRAGHTVLVARASAVCNGYTSGAATADSAQPTLAWSLRLPVKAGLSLAVDALAFTAAGTVYSAAAGVLYAGWGLLVGGAAAGAVSDAGAVSLSLAPTPAAVNSITWHNAAQSRAVGRVGQGVFRLESAPIKTGVFQIQAGSLVGSANNAGVISGGGWTGTVDYLRGIVTWSRNTQASGTYPWTNWTASNPVAADELTYNAVFLQYIPLDPELIGLGTARLPIDGKVPGYRKGGQVLVHNTLSTPLPASPVRDQAYSLGRQRIGAVVVRSASGVRVPGSRYEVDFNAGTITIPAASDLTGIDQPMTVFHRIEDRLLVTEVDISGQVSLASTLTHDYPAGTSFCSSLLLLGDLFARSFGHAERTTWLGNWGATSAGTVLEVAAYNTADYPFTITNRGAITERWAVIFQTSGTVRIVGESVGQIGTGLSITVPISPVNPQTGVPYFVINPLGWGSGWAVGNVLLFETAAAGAPAWVARTVLQGPATETSDQATLMFGCDVDA